MITSLSQTALANFVSRQVNTFLPDDAPLNLCDHSDTVDKALERLAWCFKHVSMPRYCREGVPHYDHLMADQHCQFLWYLSNQLWQDTRDRRLADKLFCLNRILNSFSCMYDTQMPAVFLLLHATGTVLGKGTYGEFFVTHHNCTIGAHRGAYPVLGRGVALASNSAVIGPCTVGDLSAVGCDTTVFAQDVPPSHLARRDQGGGLLIQPSTRCFAQSFFNVDITSS